MINLNDTKIPVSVIFGFVIGLIIGMIVGIANKGYFLEIITRSILSGLIMSGVLFLVEQLLRKYTPEIFEETRTDSNLDIKEESEDISLEELYKTSEEGFGETNEQEHTPEKEFLKNIKESENTPEEQQFSELEEFPYKSNLSGLSEEGSYQESYFDKQGTEKPAPEFSPTEFRKVEITPSELGITREGKGGITNEFIIPPKGVKPIPKDYKKLAQIIRSKLHEEE